MGKHSDANLIFTYMCLHSNAPHQAKRLKLYLLTLTLSFNFIALLLCMCAFKVVFSKVCPKHCNPNRTKLHIKGPLAHTTPLLNHWQTAVRVIVQMYSNS